MASYHSMRWSPGFFIVYCGGKLHRHTLESGRGHLDVWRDTKKRQWAYEVAYDGVRLPGRYAKTEEGAKDLGLAWAAEVEHGQT